MNWKHSVLFLVLLVFAHTFVVASIADEIPKYDKTKLRLLPRTPGPLGLNITKNDVFEVLNEQTNMIDRVQEWTSRQHVEEWVQDRNGRTYLDRYSREVTNRQILSSEPLSVRLKKYPDAVRCEECENFAKSSEVHRKVAETPSPTGPSNTHPSKRLRSIPNEKLADALPDFSESRLLDPDRSNSLTEKTPKPIRELAEKEIAAASSINWSVGSKPLSEKGRKQLLKTLEETKAATSIWLSAVDGRFDFCPADEAERKTSGKHESLYIPHEVARGRIYIAGREIGLLHAAIESNDATTKQIAQALVRIERRLDSLGSYCQLMNQDGKAPFLKKYQTAKDSLSQMARAHNAFKSDAEKEWAARWQTLAVDISIAAELSHLLNSEAQQEISKMFKAFASEHPWEDSISDQFDLAETLYEATSTLKESYPDLATEIEAQLQIGSMNQRRYGELTLLAGAIEDIRVLSGTIVSALTVDPQDPERD